MDINDSQGIVTEILEENRLLKETLRKVSENKEVESLSSVVIEDLEDKLKITGVLLAEGMHNGIWYGGDKIEEMIKNYKDYIVGMDMTVEHEKTAEYGNKVVGKHDSVEFNPTLKAALYSCVIDDEDAVKDIREGKFGATSMRIGTQKVTVGDSIKAISLTPINNTLTQFPACQNCHVFSTEDLSLNYYGIQDVVVSTGGEKVEMEEDNKPYATVIMNIASREELENMKSNWDIVGVYKGDTILTVLKSLKDVGEVSLEEHSATEAQIKAMKTRCAKYPISPKLEHGGHVTKPGQYANIPESMFADPCSYKYPMDDAHVMAAWAYASKPENKSKGGYSDAEWSWMRGRIKKRMKASGHKVEEKSEDENLNKDGKEEVKEGEEELKRKRCPYCNELYESISKHLQHCDVRKLTMNKVYNCKFCDESFDNEIDFANHLPDCEKYQLTLKDELSEEENEEETKEETKEEVKEEESKEKETKEEEGKEKKEEVKEVKKEEVKEPEKKEEPKVEEKKEEPKEEKKEEPKKDEEKIVKKEPKKKLSKEEVLEYIKKQEGSMQEKAANMLVIGEKDRW